MKAGGIEAEKGHGFVSGSDAEQIIDQLFFGFRLANPRGVEHVQN